ncbi:MULTISPECIES: nucleotide exchange factor GrpE [unclassified Corallococcus]|uniref:nucleotide exchange factor GrpE n=1 Tax=unclassified Corallococcus TaxID=2685029 RepID=UPI001A8F03D5|nr:MULTISPECIES: nucleotide exchange factor GrpE [unclassified Corallococcus]MBN9685738.1 nucleotide exchange factor GrpE [Corallococcus sp. NCSPR001]WAS82817.1 nucleotide exchange factor GrpE [Corallococcus sp. NCRR]
MDGNPRSDETPETQPPADTQVEAADDTQADAAQDGEVARLQAELEAARRRVNELARGLQDLTKDREEFKQRITRERERMLDVERGNVARTLLEAIDELDLVLNASQQDSSPVVQGVRMIRDSLLSKAQATGIERIQVVGRPYDPNLAEAADMEVTPVPADDQKVVAEFRAGYRLKDRVIRPARVKVARYVAPAQA